MTGEEHIPLCSDSNCETVATLMAEETLGVVHPPESQALIGSYVTRCSRCRQRLAQYATASQIIPLTAAEASPSVALRERIISAARQQAPGTSRPAPQAAPRPAFRLPQWAWQLASGALTLALAGSIYWGYTTQQQLTTQQANVARNRAIIISAFGNDDALELRLTSPTAATARASLFVSPGAPSVALYVKGLPALDPQQTYQLSLRSVTAVQRIGTFNVDQNGRAWVLIRPNEALQPFDEALISVEPSGGSPTPTGTVVLLASR
jgi:anti-sigma-K factor RskA